MPGSGGKNKDEVVIETLIHFGSSLVMGLPGCLSVCKMMKIEVARARVSSS